jgi:outer membrane protein assembly factor BamB
MRTFRRLVGLMSAAAFLWSAASFAQSDDRGDWSVTGADPAQSGWQKSESQLTPEDARTQVKFLWRIKLGQPSKDTRDFSEPLLAGRLINAQGFKDFVYWSSADTLYAVDSELGTLIWKKQFPTKAPAPAPGCSISRLSLFIEPPQVINFHAHRRRGPNAPRPPRPAATQANERRLGVAPGGGYFGLKGIYVLTADGMLHEQVMTTGADFAPPVRFLPAANGRPYGMNILGKEVYSATGRGCGGVANGIWSLDMASPDYHVTNLSTPGLRPLALTGPVLSPDGTAFFVTGGGTSDPAAGVEAGSVIALSKDLKVQDWYTPAGGMGNYENVSPVTFEDKDEQLVVTPGKDGTIALLNAASLGGSDHHTPLFETAPVARPGAKHSWDGFATWQDKDGDTWAFASVSAEVILNGSSLKRNGPTPHGAIVAFKVDAAGQPALRPVWISRDMVNPAPPRVANGVVIALSGGDASTHATLYVLNAATGEELYSSKNEIPTSAEFSGVSVGDGHAFFTDRDNFLYSFGIGIEH